MYTDSQFRQDTEAALQESVQLTARTALQYERDIQKLNAQLLQLRPKTFPSLRVQMNSRQNG